MKPIPVLLLTGANNHDWKRTAPFLKKVLEDSGRFAVTLTEDPSAALEDAAALAGYPLILLDYNGPAWTPLAQRNFLAAVAGGTGVAAVHASNNAFPEWKEYEKMIALTWRPESGHGEFHDFTVEMDDPNHPITRGLAAFQTPDELYHKLVRTPGVELKVLASAWSEPARGGTGRREPMITVNHYGRGRVFYHALGHVWPGDGQAHRGCSLAALESPGFQALLLRGCEWAATGEVTVAANSPRH